MPIQTATNVLEQSKSIKNSPFTENDLRFYLAVRDCHTDFQALTVQIERSLWVATFRVLELAYGEDWIIEVDKNKRKNWAQVREDYRATAAERPLQEFCSIPDLRDIITSSKHWRRFQDHVPITLDSRKGIIEVVNRTIIPFRNRVAHPTRWLEVTFTEFNSMRDLSLQFHVSCWRGLKLESSPVLFANAPPPRWY